MKLEKKIAKASKELIKKVGLTAEQEKKLEAAFDTAKAKSDKPKLDWKSIRPGDRVSIKLCRAGNGKLLSKVFRGTWLATEAEANRNKDEYLPIGIMWMDKPFDYGYHGTTHIGDDKGSPAAPSGCQSSDQTWKKARAHLRSLLGKEPDLKDRRFFFVEGHLDEDDDPHEIKLYEPQLLSIKTPKKIIHSDLYIGDRVELKLYRTKKVSGFDARTNKFIRVQGVVVSALEDPAISGSTRAFVYVWLDKPIAYGDELSVGKQHQSMLLDHCRDDGFLISTAVLSFLSRGAPSSVGTIYEVYAEPRLFGINTYRDDCVISKIISKADNNVRDFTRTLTNCLNIEYPRYRKASQ